MKHSKRRINYNPRVLIYFISSRRSREQGLGGAKERWAWQLCSGATAYQNALNDEDRIFLIFERHKFTPNELPTPLFYLTSARLVKCMYLQFNLLAQPGHAHFQVVESEVKMWSKLSKISKSSGTSGRKINEQINFEVKIKFIIFPYDPLFPLYGHRNLYCQIQAMDLSIDS